MDNSHYLLTAYTLRNLAYGNGTIIFQIRIFFVFRFYRVYKPTPQDIRSNQTPMSRKPTTRTIPVTRQH